MLTWMGAASMITAAATALNHRCSNMDTAEGVVLFDENRFVFSSTGKCHARCVILLNQNTLCIPVTLSTTNMDIFVFENKFKILYFNVSSLPLSTNNPPLYNGHGYSILRNVNYAGH